MATVCPPEGASGCDPVVERATSTEFLLKNRSKANNFIWGELVGGGELSFLIENLPRDGSGCPGWWMFDEMMRHFGDAVSVIQGNWTYGDNLATVNTRTAGGMSIAQAAGHTRTGRYAARYNCTSVVVVQADGQPGAYTAIRVRFEK